MPDKAQGAEPQEGRDLSALTDDKTLDSIVESVVTEEGSPDAAPAAPAAPAREAAKPEPEPAAQPRDERGRFATRAEAKDEVEGTPPEGAPPSPPEAPTEPTAEAPAAPAVEAAAPEEGWPEYEYRADNAAHTLPGSEVGTDGVFIPNERLGLLHQLLSAGHTFHHGWRQLDDERQGQIEAANARADQAVQRTNELYAQVEQLVKDPEVLRAWVEDSQGQWELFKARAEKQALEVERDAQGQRADALEQQRRDQELRPQLEAELENVVLRLAQEPGYEAVDLERVYRRLHRDLGLVFKRADRDYPAYGWRKGEVLVDWDRVRAEFDDERDLKKSSSTAAAQAVERSRQRTGPSGAPPTVTAAGEAPGPGESAGLAAKDRGEADRILDHVTSKMGMI